MSEPRANAATALAATSRPPVPLPAWLLSPLRSVLVIVPLQEQRMGEGAAASVKRDAWAPRGRQWSGRAPPSAQRGSGPVGRRRRDDDGAFESVRPGALLDW
jgi:hypothetical protein